MCAGARRDPGMADHTRLQRWLRDYPSDAYHSTHAEDATRARIDAAKQRLAREGHLDDDDLSFVRLLRETYAFGFAEPAKRRGRTQRAPPAAPQEPELALVVDMAGYRHAETTRALKKRDDDLPLMNSAAAGASVRSPTERERAQGCASVGRDVLKAVRRYLTRTPQACTPGYEEGMGREALVARAEAAFSTDVRTRFDTWDDDGAPVAVMVVDGFPGWVDLASKRAALFDCCKHISWALRPCERPGARGAGGSREAKRARR